MMAFGVRIDDDGAMSVDLENMPGLDPVLGAAGTAVAIEEDRQAAHLADGDKPPEQVGYRQVLAEPNFRRLWQAKLWSGAGEALAQIAMPLLVYDLTGSERLVGVIAVCQTLPRVLLAPLAGVLLDRIDRRKLMLLADAERAFLVALIPFSNAVWQIGILAVLIAIGNSIGGPAELAAVPSVAGKRRLLPALSLMQVTSSVTRVVVPAAGAGLIAITGAAAAFWIQSLAFIASFSFLMRLVLPPLERAASPESGVLEAERIVEMAWRELRAGLRAMWVNPVVRGITAIESLWQFVGAALVIGGVAYMERTADLGDRAEAAYALMTTSMAAGAVVGALTASRIERRVGRAWLMAVGYLGPLFLLPAAAVPPVPVLYVCVFCFGLADAWAVIAFQTYLAEAVPDHLRGRVYAGWMAAVTAASAAGFAVVGWLTPILSPEWMLAVAGLVVGIGGPAVLYFTGAMAAMLGGRHVEAPAS